MGDIYKICKPYQAKGFKTKELSDVECLIFFRGIIAFSNYQCQKSKLLYDFCKKESLDIVSVSYLWCLRNSNVVSLITNVRDIKQLHNNIKFAESSLSIEILTKLDFIFNNCPINQYTNIKYEITKRKL